MLNNVALRGHALTRSVRLLLTTIRPLAISLRKSVEKWLLMRRLLVAVDGRAILLQALLFEELGLRVVSLLGSAAVLLLVHVSHFDPILFEF